MIELKKVTKSFGGKLIINELSLTIKDGQIVTFVGPSGSGKSTILRCLAGLEQFDKGEILKNNQPFYPQRTPGTIGVVFQEFQLFPHLTVIENITIALKMTRQQPVEACVKEAMPLLKQFQMWEKREAYPHELSGGQKQRVAICRALVMNPEVLCYDEPTSALDSGLVKDVATLIIELKKSGMTQIVVTHDLTFAEMISDVMITMKEEEE